MALDAKAHGVPTLEDQVFGFCDDPVLPPPPVPPPPRPAEARGDAVTGVLLPVVATSVVIVVVLWSISKSVQYTELFQSNPRYQYGMWLLNVLVIMLSTLVLCFTRTAR